jgi:hypothetical protein
MSNGLEAIRIRVINKDGNDDVQMWVWADSTVGAFKKRLGAFYKAQPGQINLVLKVGLERYVLARTHRLKVRSTANSTIDGGVAILSSLSKTGPPAIYMWRVIPSWTGDTKLLHPSSMVEYTIYRNLGRCIRASAHHSNPIGTSIVHQRFGRLETDRACSSHGHHHRGHAF